MNLYFHICEDCGNQKEFIAKRDFIESVTEDRIIDSLGEVIECVSQETTDSEAEGDHYNIQCCICSSEEVTQILSNEISIYKYKHTRKDKTWSKDELKEDERDFTILEEALIEKLGGVAK